MTRLRLENIRKSFGATEVLRGLNLEIAPGELLVILGAIGEGKTTLLNLLAGLLVPDAGKVWFDDREVTSLDAHQRNIAFVFQDYALYPHMTVLQNLRFPLENQRWDEGAIRARTREVLARLHLEEQASLLPRQLSGGQKQRVALGRALVRDPAVFLFDEPLSSLDPQLREHLRLELKELHRSLGRTFVYVTHDQHSALTLGDRIAFLEAGRVLQVDAPAVLYERPKTLSVASFLGTPPINRLSLPELARLDPVNPPPGAAQAGVRPEALKAEARPEGPWTVAWIQDLGSARYAHFHLDGKTLIALATDPGLQPGGPMHCTVERGKIMFFNGEGFTVK